MLLTPVRYLVWFLGRLIFALRYRVQVVGRDAVALQPPPYLFLPNHPAYADPPNVLIHLWPRFQVRPLLLETNFQTPLLGFIGRLLRAIKVPDLTTLSAESRQRAESAVSAATAALAAGDNVVLWPSGRLSRDGSERVGAARAAADLLAAVPQATVVLVRTRGLYGSRFSWADRVAPDMIRGIVRGVLNGLANLIVLLPGRRITMTLEAFPSVARPAPTRETLNPWLEAWFNADVNPEPPTFVPYHFAFGPRAHTYPTTAADPELDLAGLKPETKSAVAELLAERLKRPVEAEEFDPAQTLSDLGLDSLDAMELSLEVERRFGFTGSRVPVTLGELWALAEGKLGAAASKPAPPAWFRPVPAPPRDFTELQILGDTIPAAFLHRVRERPKAVACADDTSGVLTYERLLLGATVLADRFRALPGDHLGLMLPASVAGITSLLAAHLAGKLPVLLNWTTGPAAMGHAVELLQLSHVVTARQFVDRTQVEVPGAKLFFLEEVRSTVGRWEKLRRLLAVTLLRGRTIRRLQAQLTTQPDDRAVVLFTSGSEKAPKAVPLTHRNVLSDLRAAIPLLGLKPSDSGLVFLPLFHSFGHTVTGMLPLLTGLKAVYHPDPTDAAGLARKCAAYETTALAATPTFLGYLLDKAKPGELETLRIIVVGAERCPVQLVERTAQQAPQATVMEGYGVTECAPVVAVNPYAKPKPGTVGRPLVGVKVVVRDLETNQVLPTGKQGMLHVAGPNVFPGYLGLTDSPFLNADGERWYITGDLAEIDADGYITLHGRLKRFLKAGGEMISLPALEEPLARAFPPTDAGPRVAVEGIETDTGRHIVLFTTEPMSLKDANAVLVADGFRGVMRLDEVRAVPSIPLLGTGKVDYKQLRALLTAPATRK